MQLCDWACTHSRSNLPYAAVHFPRRNEDMSVYVKKVQFKLHDSYPNATRVVSKPPYEVTETGWGEFEVVIKIYFEDPNERPVRERHDFKCETMTTWAVDVEISVLRCFSLSRIKQKTHRTVPLPRWYLGPRLLRFISPRPVTLTSDRPPPPPPSVAVHRWRCTTCWSCSLPAARRRQWWWARSRRSSASTTTRWSSRSRRWWCSSCWRPPGRSHWGRTNTRQTVSTARRAAVEGWIVCRDILISRQETLEPQLTTNGYRVWNWYDRILGIVWKLWWWRGRILSKYAVSWKITAKMGMERKPQHIIKVFLTKLLFGIRWLDIL